MMKCAAIFRTGAHPESIHGSVVRARLSDVAVGEVCDLWSSAARDAVIGQGVVVAIDAGMATISLLTASTGLSTSTVVMPTGSQQQIVLSSALMGAVLDGMGNLVERMDGAAPVSIVSGDRRDVMREAIDYRSRRAVSSVFGTGIRAVDALLTVGHGQRMGVFAAAGSGKTTFAEMLIDHARADVYVIALIGERGREVASFVQRIANSSNASRTIIVQAASDAPPATRANAAQLASAIAEYFRDLGADVLMVLDSMTRYARALRDVALLAGELPARRGYPASVFEAMPRLLERPGQTESGSITAFYTVLLEDEEESDPIGEEVKSLLDGHIHLSGKLAGRGHFPAIDLLKSGSRLFNQLATPEQLRASQHARSMAATLEDIQLMRDLGEYKPGLSRQYDAAVAGEAALLSFLRQRHDEYVSVSQALEALSVLAK